MKKASLGIGAAMMIFLVLGILVGMNISNGITLVRADPCTDNDGDYYSVEFTPGSETCCGPGQNEVCIGGDDCNDTDINIYPGATETCNNLDDDCDDSTDEDFTYNSLNIGDFCQGIGNCSTSWGEVYCKDLYTADCTSNDPGSDDYGGSPEECNSYDDDCDGESDEDFTYNSLNIGDFCQGIGACSSSWGEVYCKDIITADCTSNDPGSDDYGGSPEVCDSVDNDCDGENNESGVCEMLSITLSNAPIQFLNINPLETKNASTGNGFPLTVTIDSETTVTDVSIAVKSNSSNFCTDYPTCSGDTFAVSNMEWNPTSSFPGTDYDTSEATVCTGLDADDTCDIYNQLYMPSGQKSGSYSVGIIITATSS